MPKAVAPKFHYHSVQTHAVMHNSTRRVKRNIVSVNGAKGRKTVEVLDTNKSRKVKRNSKALKPKEIANIRKGIFMPTLFRRM